MASIPKVILFLAAACFTTAAARADIIVYSFTGTDNTIKPGETEAFQISTTGFINPMVDGPAIDFSCSALQSNTNCSDAGVSFGVQSVMGAFADQLQFDSPRSGTIYSFPTSSFTTLGTFASQSIYGTLGTLTVTDQSFNPIPAVASPEPSSFVLGGMILVLGFAIKRVSLRLQRIGAKIAGATL